jgi:hypothetical protein
MQARRQARTYTEVGRRILLGLRNWYGCQQKETLSACNSRKIHVLIGKTSRLINILTTHNRTYQYTSTFYLLIVMSSNLLLIFVLCCWQWSLLQRRRSPRAVRPTRAAHSHRTPWRGLSRACGVSGLKRPRRRVLHIVLPARLLRAPATCPVYRAHRRGHTVTCSCANK